MTDKFGQIVNKDKKMVPKTVQIKAFRRRNPQRRTEKSVYLCSHMQKAGAEEVVIMAKYRAFFLCSRSLDGKKWGLV